MNPRFLWLLLAALLPSSPVVGENGVLEKVTSVQDTWSLPGILGGGVKANDAYVDGSFFLTVPAYSSIGQDGRLAGDAIFVEPYTSWGEEGEVAVSLGMGWRHLFSGQSVSAVTQHDGHQAGFFEEGGFVGANLFFDMLDTQFDNRFWQLGFGVEAGTRYLEMRANYYLPLSDRKLAEEIRTRESFTTQRSVTEFGEPFATGHTIQQEVTLSRLATTTTIERLFRRFEEGMEGWDAEVALLVPWIDRWMDVKVIGGYYSFDNQPFGPQIGGTGDVDGWKIGAEVRPVPAVVLNATWYEDDRLTGSDWTAGVRLEVPFEAGDLGDGKGFWDRIGDAFRPRRRHLAERMAEPVRRQNAAIKTSSSVEEDEEATEVKVVTKVVSQSKQRIVLADTVVFVDNAIGKATNPGTYEAPLDTITNGHLSGNSTFGSSAIVFVQGRPEAYVESVLLGQGVRLIGSGSFPGQGGQWFWGRARLRPTVNGGFWAKNIQGTVQVTGFDIRNGLFEPDPERSGGSAIFFENVANAIITRNHISGLPDQRFAIWVDASVGSSHAIISDNVVTTGLAGILVYAGGSASIRAEISRNLLSGTEAYGISAQVGGDAVGFFTIDDNTVIDGGGGAGISLLASFQSSAVFTVTNNHVARNFGHGIELLIAGESTASLFAISNHVERNTAEGISVGTLGADAHGSVFLSGNTVIFNGGDQITAREQGGSLNFLSNGALSNDVREAAGRIFFLFKAIEGTEGGSILINDFYRPANADLP